VNVLRLYLWKEWREHRLALGVVGASALVLAALSRQFTPRSFLGDPLYPLLAALALVLIALLAVGAELLAERRGGTLAWLERLPAGLTAPFWAKLAFHVVVTLAAAGLGIGLALASAWTRGVAAELPDEAGIALLLVLAGAVGLWTFAASSWTSRSILALISALFVLAGLGAPLWFLGLGGYRLQAGLVTGSLTLVLLGALPSAWLGFVYAGRLGRGPGRASLLGVGAAAAVFLPFWGWGAWELHERDRFGPELAGFAIQQAVVTDDQQTAFVQAWAPNGRWYEESVPSTVLRVDLASGRSEPITRGAVTLWRKVEDTADGRSGDSVQIYDHESQTSLAFSAASGAPLGTKEARVSTSRFAQRRGWLHASAPFRLATTLVDQATGVVVHPATLGLPRDAEVWSDLGHWFVVSREGMFRLDPETKTVTRAPWMDEIDRDFGPRLPDGRFFGVLSNGGVVLVDPAAETVTPLEGADEGYDVYRAYGRGPFQEDEVVLLQVSGRVYRFDEAGLRLVPVPFLSSEPFMNPNRVITSADGFVFAQTEPTLVRLDPVTGATEQLFPRPR